MEKHNTVRETVNSGQAKGVKGSAFEKAADFTFFITPQMMLRIFPLALLLALLFAVYIYAQHHAARMQKERETLKKEIKELRAEYITIKSDLMDKSKQSEIVNKLEPLGVKELKTPPAKITEENLGKK